MSTCTKNDEPLRCRKCGEMKPADCFHRDKSRKMGRVTICKACKSAYSKTMAQAGRKRYTKVMKVLEEVRYEKVCKACGRLLQSHMFSKKPNSRDSLCTYCRDCYSRRRRKHQYGLTDEMLDKMLAVETCQMPGCGRKLERRLHTHFDHCHKSGKVRAVLCQKCNTMLGYIEKNLHLVQPMLDYINEHKGGNEAA